MRTVSLLVVGAGLLAAAIWPAVAETAAPGGPLAVVEDCAAVPQPEGQLAPPPTDSLTDTLAPCNGVIAPPPTGDADIAITPPPVGETPVISPDEVPQQPANPE